MSDYKIISNGFELQKRWPLHLFKTSFARCHNFVSKYQEFSIQKSHILGLVDLPKSVTNPSVKLF
jgi:hypothetical protein